MALLPLLAPVNILVDCQIVPDRGGTLRISIIVAVARNGVIGREGRLPWHLAEDLRRFKRLTMGHTIIMGRRTWESIGRPLPGRRMVIITRQAGYRPDAEEVHRAGSLDEALRVAAASGDDEAFIIGGAELFREALPRTDRIYLSWINADVPGDTYFPLDDIDWQQWETLQSERCEANDKNAYPHEFKVLQRRSRH